MLRLAWRGFDRPGRWRPGTAGELLAIGEAAGHDGWHRMQGLLGSYRWDWQDLRGELAGLAVGWPPCDPGDLIGPGIAIDDTGQQKARGLPLCAAETTAHADESTMHRETPSHYMMISFSRNSPTATRPRSCKNSVVSQHVMHTEGDGEIPSADTSLSRDQQIVALYASGASMPDLAVQFGVTRQRFIRLSAVSKEQTLIRHARSAAKRVKSSRTRSFNLFLTNIRILLPTSPLLVQLARILRPDLPCSCQIYQRRSYVTA